MKVPKRGEVRDWVAVEGLLGEGASEDERATWAGVEVGLVHVGPEQADVWGTAWFAVQIAEQKRLAQARRGFTADEVPALFSDGYATPEAAKELAGLFADVFKEGCQLRGTEGGPELLAYLPALAKIDLLARVIDAQRLRRSVRPPGSDSGGVVSERLAKPKRGSKSRRAR